MASDADIAELKTHILYIREAVDQIKTSAGTAERRHFAHVREDNQRFDAVNSKLNKIVGGLVLFGALAGFVAKVFGG